MKKISVAIVMAVVLALLVPATGFAAGKLTVTEETFVKLSYIGYYAGYVFAEVENTGNKPVQFNGGLMELFDAEGNSIESSDVYYCYPNVLQPGENGYLYVYKGVEEAETQDFIDDYALTVTGKSDTGSTIVRLPTTGRYEVATRNYWVYTDMIAEVENDTEQTLYDIGVVYALRDADGNLLYVDSCSPYYVGLMPGSKIEVRYGMNSSYVEYMEENGIEPATVEAIAYATVE